MKRLEKLLRPHLLNLVPYSSARDDFKGKASIYLDANENPYGSVPEGSLNRYPDPHQVQLKNELSALKGVEPGSIFIGNGSDEPIDLLIRAFCEPGKDSIVVLPPTYGMYRVSAQVNHVGVKSVPLTRCFQIDRESVSKAIDHRDKIIFICSPNNPSGNELKREDMFWLLKKSCGLVVVDEAYIDFASTAGMLDAIHTYPNLVILQTFSKAWGLAGIRLGIAFAHDFVIGVLNKIKPPYNIDAISQEMGLRALSAKDSMKTLVDSIIRERLRIVPIIASNPLVDKVMHSDANFLLVKFKKTPAIINYLLEHGVVVRDRSKEMHCEGCLRITVGTREENDRLIQLLDELR